MCAVLLVVGLRETRVGRDVDVSSALMVLELGADSVVVSGKMVVSASSTSGTLFDMVDE